MIDFPEARGRMCDWDTVAAVDGAQAALASLSQRARIYIATGAADSSEDEIKKAFDRVNLSQYISGYFCQQNLGVGKGSIEFFEAIVNKLNQPAAKVVMIGDSLSRDIVPAAAAGIEAIWLSSDDPVVVPANIRRINSLRQLCQPSANR